MDGDRSETEREAMVATHAALAEHGYADLTIQRIADEFPKSKSLLYYHYDDKEAILRAFLEYLVEQFRTHFEFDTTDDPQAALDSLLDGLVPRDFDDEQRAFRVAVLELLVQAPHDEMYATRFVELHRAIHDSIAAVIEAGVEAERFHDVDPDETASLLVAIASGGMLWGVTADESINGRVRSVLDAYLTAELYR